MSRSAPGVPLLTTLDLIIPTHNRATLLAKALDSVIHARKPAELQVTCCIVDNNSTDSTRLTAMEYVRQYPHLFRYLFESTPGVSYARNAAIRAGTSDWVGMIDDDEEMSEGWFEAVCAHIRKPDTGFLFGPCRVRETVVRPAWFGKHIQSHNVIGHLDLEQDDTRYEPGSQFGLFGGNMALARPVLERLKVNDEYYSTRLGRTGKNLASCEDVDLNERVIKCGVGGWYVRDMVIYHYCPPERLTKPYHRRWHYGHGLGEGVIAAAHRKNGHLEDAVYVGRIPRYKLRQLLGHLLRAPVRFSDELKVRYYIGYLRGLYSRP